MTRRRYKHWCDICHGHVGPDSPCYEGPDEELEDPRDEYNADDEDPEPRNYLEDE